MLTRHFFALWVLVGVIFTSFGFVLGYSGYFSKIGFHKHLNSELRILTESSLLFTDEFVRHIEIETGLKLVVDTISDPDTFLEKASQYDLLWARQDWLVGTELHFYDFAQDPVSGQFLASQLSADFYDPIKKGSSMIPLLWTLPMVVKSQDLDLGKIVSVSDLLNKPGTLDWPFDGIEKFFPGLDPERVSSSQGKTPEWRLTRLTLPENQNRTDSDWWFPQDKIRPFVVSLSFIENPRFSESEKFRILKIWMESRALSRLASASLMAITLVSAEELLPPLQRASCLRRIGLERLGRH